MLPQEPCREAAGGGPCRGPPARKLGSETWWHRVRLNIGAQAACVWELQIGSGVQMLQHDNLEIIM